MRTSHAFLLLFFFSAACSRSQSDADGAKSEFAKRYSCPEERVTVKQRKDLDPAALLNPPVKVDPPDEVKKDPGRLAKWQADRKAEDDQAASGYRRSYTVFETEGCDHRVLLACTHADILGSSNGSGGTALSCQEKPL